MADLSTTISSIESIVEATLPGKTKLHNPYDFTDNSEAFQREGYGVQVGPGVESPFQEFNSSFDDIIVGVVLTREFYGQDHNTDAVNNVVAELYQDTRTIRTELLKNYPTGVAKVIYSDTTGIETEEKIASLTVNFVMTFIDAI
jgi:hypothetical protein